MARPKKTKSAEIKAVDEAAAIEKVEKLLNTDVSAKVAQLKKFLVNTLDGVGDQVTEMLKEYSGIDEAINAKTKRFKELYQVEDELLRLDEAKGVRAEIETNNANYIEECRIRRDRENEDYEYELALNRKKQLDLYNESIAKRRKAEDEATEKKTKEWAEREEAIATKENEIIQLRESVAGFDEIKRKEVAKEVAIATNSLKKDLEQQFALSKKDSETELKLANQTIEALKTRLSDSEETIHQLSEQLAAANMRVETIASQAVNSASGRAALEAVQQNIASVTQNTPNRR